jgi:hypothetical protein
VLVTSLPRLETLQVRVVTRCAVEKPYPLALADEYGFPLQQHLVGSEPFFAVQDWISGLARSKCPSRLWYQMKRRTSAKGALFGGRILKLAYRASNGRAYQMDFADEKALYEVALKLRANTPALHAVWRRLWDSAIGISSCSPETAKQMVAWMHNTHGSGVYRGLFLQALSDALHFSEPQFDNPAYLAIFKFVWAGVWKGFFYKPNPTDAEIGFARELVRDYYLTLVELVEKEPPFMSLKRAFAICDEATRKMVE